MMKRIVVSALVLGTVGAAACRDASAPASELAITMASAFQSAPAGFSSLSSSYVGDEGMAFAPDLVATTIAAMVAAGHFILAVAATVLALA